MRLGLWYTTKASRNLFSRTNAIDDYAQRAMIAVLQASLRDGQFLSICPYFSIYGLQSTGLAAEGKAISFAAFAWDSEGNEHMRGGKTRLCELQKAWLSVAEADVRPRCCLLTITFYCLQLIALDRR